MAFCVMIRDVGEDPLSPVLCDLDRGREGERERGRERERERERGGGGGRTTLDTRWLRLLCLVCWCRGEALKVKKLPLRLSSRNACYPSPIFKPGLEREEIYPYLFPLGGIGKRNIIFIKAHVQEVRIQNRRIKTKISKSFFFSFENIFSLTKFAHHTVCFCGREFAT